MSDKTGIEWTQATWNPTTGCSKVSQGCKNCYAEREWTRLSGYTRSVYQGREFTDVQVHPERLDWPLRYKKPHMIFVNSMSDLFHEDVPADFIQSVFDTMAVTPHHTYQILTKRPERMSHIVPHMRGPLGLKFEDGPWRNVWLGVSAEDQETADGRIPWVLKTPAAVRFLSLEPLLGPIDLRHIHTDLVEIDVLTGDHGVHRPLAGKSDARIHWIIAGGESGPNARPSHPEWFRSVQHQCQAAEVPFFFKQWGSFSEVPKMPSGVGRMVKAGDVVITTDGRRAPIQPRTLACDLEGQGIPMRPMSKKKAGALLDGREWKEFPETEKGSPATVSPLFS